MIKDISAPALYQKVYFLSIYKKPIVKTIHSPLTFDTTWDETSRMWTYIWDILELKKPYKTKNTSQILGLSLIYSNSLCLEVEKNGRKKAFVDIYKADKCN